MKKSTEPCGKAPETLSEAPKACLGQIPRRRKACTQGDLASNFGGQYRPNAPGPESGAQGLWTAEKGAPGAPASRERRRQGPGFAALWKKPTLPGKKRLTEGKEIGYNSGCVYGIPGDTALLERLAVPESRALPGRRVRGHRPRGRCLTDGGVTNGYQTYLSAQEAPRSEGARLPCPDVHPQRPQGSVPPPRQGPRCAQLLSGV